jgi:8-oxo-dGTP pyrophosphatase MutT (NUDIX family)
VSAAPKRKRESNKSVVRLRSAGGIVVKGKADKLRVAVIQSQYGTWVFPKGMIEEGEEPEQAARRELAEETGLQRLRLNAPMGWTQHEFEREGRRFRNRVCWFLYEAGPRAEMRLDPQEEVLDCGWFAPDEALPLLTHANHRRLLRKALALLRAERTTAHTERRDCG